MDCMQQLRMFTSKYWFSNIDKQIELVVLLIMTPKIAKNKIKMKKKLTSSCTTVLDKTKLNEFH